MNDTAIALSREWSALQSNHERYEHSAQLIKMAAVALLATEVFIYGGTMLHGHALLCIAVFVSAALWIQEALLRTSQARLGTRLLRIESLQRSEDASPAQALQLHTEWASARGGFGALLGEYTRNALRPTVAFPYAPILAILVILRLCL
jgi:hypothetical protein